MRTSLNEIKVVDDYLSGEQSPEDSLLVQARMVIDPALRMKVALLKRVHSIIKMYGRNSLKKELNEMHDRILNDPGKLHLRQQVENIFNEK